jgi:HTH-type transcriptional regulator / antitoxin HigA
VNQDGTEGVARPEARHAVESAIPDRVPRCANLQEFWADAVVGVVLASSVRLDQVYFLMETWLKNRREPKAKPMPPNVNAPGDRYLEMVRENPLRVFHREEEYQRAIATLDRLSDRGNGRTADETEYLLALAVFVEKYEEEHHPNPPVSRVDMLRYLIETRQKTQREVAAGAGLSDSTISEILAAKRKLSVKQVEALARFFKVKAAVFLDGR